MEISAGSQGLDLESLAPALDTESVEVIEEAKKAAIKIQDILETFYADDTVVLVLKIIFFLLLFAFCFLVMKYITDYRIIKNMATKTYDRLSENEKVRLNQNKEKQLVYGDSEEKGIVASLDRLITYSGIKRKLKFISTEVILMSWVMVSAFSIIIGQLIIKNMLFGLVFAALYIVITYMTLLVMSNIQYKRVHSSVIKFVNIIENFAATNNDIISILEKSCGYIGNPLKQCVYSCVVEARNSGDKDFALRKLQDSVENTYFKELVRTLRIASNYEANYTEVIREGKNNLQQSLKYESEKQAIRNNGRNDMLMIGVVGVLCVFMSQSVSGMTLKELWFETGIFGNIIFYYLIFVAIVVIYLGFIKGMKK